MCLSAACTGDPEREKLRLLPVSCDSEHEGRSRVCRRWPPDGISGKVHLAKWAVGAAATRDVGATRRAGRWHRASLEGLDVHFFDLFDLHHELVGIDFLRLSMENYSCLILLEVDDQTDEEDEKRDRRAYEPHGLVCA